MTLNAILVDDERRSRNSLKLLLEKYCPEVIILGEAANIMEAVKLINLQQPELVFLDIHLPQQDGFKLFDYFVEPNFEVVFTTAYSQYSVTALRMAAVDYLLKPINKDELKDAVRRTIQRKEQKKMAQNISTLKHVLTSGFRKLALPNASGYTYVNLEEIVVCEASRNYTNIYLADGRKMLISKNLKTYEDILENFHFLRISRSHIVNLACVESFSRANGGEIELTNKMVLAVSAHAKKELIEKLNSWEGSI
ncbi:MAG: LytTR family DNA-binding domain-containing protein [Bacteroidota bacterium]